MKFGYFSQVLLSAAFAWSGAAQSIETSAPLSTLETSGRTSSPTMKPTTRKPSKARAMKPSKARTSASPSLKPTEEPTTAVPTPTTLAPTTLAPSTDTPTTAAPTTLARTLVPTTLPTLLPTTENPTLVPTTGFPTESPSSAPTAFVLEPVPPIANLTDINNAVTRMVVEERCLAILESVEDIFDWASYWEPDSTTPLYFSSSEGDFMKGTLEGFTPTDFLDIIINATTDASATKITQIVLSAENTTSIDIAGTVCSMDLDLTLQIATMEDCSVSITSHSLMELDHQTGRLFTWRNAIDNATLYAKIAATTCGRASTSHEYDFNDDDDDDFTAADYNAPDRRPISLACTSAFEMLFPPTGISLASLTSLSFLFVPNVANFTFPAGNPSTTMTNISSGWALFGFFMKYLNPFEMTTIATITSPVDVTGSVCSFDQELTVAFAKTAALCPPLKVPGRVIMELQADTMQIRQFWSQFDNTTFWGGIEDCKTLVEASKAEAEAEKAAAKKAKKESEAEKKQAKKEAEAEKKQAKKEAKAEKKQAKKEAELEKKKAKKAKNSKKTYKPSSDDDDGSSSSHRRKSSSSSSNSFAELYLDSIFAANEESPLGAVAWVLGIGMGWAFLVFAVAYLRSPRRLGYEEVMDVEDDDHHPPTLLHL